MTGRVLAGIALRVWGVVFVVDALATWPQWIAWLITPTEADARTLAVMHASAISMVLSLITTVAVGLVLIVFSNRIAVALVPDGDPLVISADLSDLSALAFGATGMVFVVWGLKSIAGPVFTMLTKPEWMDMGSTFSYVWKQDRDAIVRGIVSAVAGTALLVGRDGLATAWRRVRGRDEMPQSTEDLP